MKKILTVLFCMSTLAFAAGETGLANFKIGAGARAAAMGEAFTATSDDASGIFWNPAGVANIEYRQAHFTHNEWIQDIRNEVAGVLFPLKNSTLGFGLMLNSIDDFESRLAPTEEPLGTFSSQNFAFILSFAKPLSDHVDFGLNLKYMNERIYVDDANAYLADVGVTYHTPVQGLKAAAVLQNVGFSTKLDKEELELPTTVRAGVAWVLPFESLQENLLVAVDYMSIFEQSSHINIGCEGRLADLLLLRCGYQTGYEEKGISAGFGLDFQAFKLDYAYMPFGKSLGNSHRFSVNFLF